MYCTAVEEFSGDGGEGHFQECISESIIHSVVVLLRNMIIYVQYGVLTT
jgi:hypothetical protein